MWVRHPKWKRQTNRSDDSLTAVGLFVAALLALLVVIQSQPSVRGATASNLTKVAAEFGSLEAQSPSGL